MAEPAGIYISVPFCRAKCTFCNFASAAFPPARMQAYVKRLEREIDSAAQTAAHVGGTFPRLVDSLYLGGGTPSLLSPELFRQVLQAVRRHFSVTADAEITMEAAPGQVEDALLATALHCGINRISLGVQSFVDREARAVGRLHTAAACRAELQRLHAAGVPRLSVDLIAGLPYQTSQSFDESLRTALDSDVEHISVYMLETDGDSRLGTEVERLRAESQLMVLGQQAHYHAGAVPSEEFCSELYMQACETLEAHGMQQYEISNFAKPGSSSRHNRKYWDRQPYFGFGLDAHSMLTLANGHAVRFRNADTLDAYLNGPAPIEVTQVGDLESFEESIFLGLRRIGGVRLADLERWQQPSLLAGLRQRARELAQEGLLREASDTLQLTARGRLLSSAVFGELLTAAPVTLSS